MAKRLVTQTDGLTDRQTDMCLSARLSFSPVSDQAVWVGQDPKGDTQEMDPANICSDICKCPVVMVHSWISRVGVAQNNRPVAQRAPR